MKPKELFKSYPVAICSIAGALVFLGLGFWRDGVCSDQRVLFATRETEAARLADNVHNGQKLDAQLNQIDNISRRISERLANPNDVAGNQQYFYKLEADNGVKLMDLHQVPPAFRKKGPVALNYSALGYSVTVQGTYTHLLKFLIGLESGERITKFVNIGITNNSASRHEDGDGIYSMSINVELLAAL